MQLRLIYVTLTTSNLQSCSPFIRLVSPSWCTSATTLAHLFPSCLQKDLQFTLKWLALPHSPHFSVCRALLGCISCPTIFELVTAWCFICMLLGVILDGAKLLTFLNTVQHFSLGPLCLHFACTGQNTLTSGFLNVF